MWVRFVDLAGILQVDGLAQRLASVESCLDRSLSTGEPHLGPASVRVTLSGGKRLRPMLCIAAAELGSVFDPKVVDGAAAVELVQVGSLVHDDIFEAAPTRRGVPTINAVEGNKHAILAGDFILARAGELAARVSAEAAALLGRTVVGLCVGQIGEMEHTFDIGRTEASYLRAIRGKTAVLFAASCEMGAICAGFEAAQRSGLSLFGEAFGMAFQLLDDVLDFVADPTALGKPVGIDVDTGVYTLPVIRALRGSNGDELDALLRAGSPDDLVAARALVMESGEIEATLSEARDWARQAVDALDVLGDVSSPVAAGLRDLPVRYLDLALDHFTKGRWPVAAG